MADHALVGHHEREPAVDDHLCVERLGEIADLGDAKLKGGGGGEEARLLYHLHGQRVEHVQPEVAAHVEPHGFCQHRVAEIADQRLVDAVVEELLQRLAYARLLIIGDDAGQHRDRDGAVFLKGLKQVEIFVHDRHGHIEILRLERRELRCELLGVKHLKDHGGIDSRRRALRLGGDGAHSPARRGAALLGEIGEKIAAQLVDGGGGKEETRIGLGLVLHHVVGCAAGLEHLFGQISGAQPLPPRLFRDASGGDGLVPIVVKGDGADGLALLRDGVKVNGDSSQFPVGIAFAGLGEELTGVRVDLAAHAEHVLPVVVEIALREALAGEDALKLLQFLGSGLAVLLEGVGVDAGDNGGIFGPSILMQATPASSIS